MQRDKPDRAERQPHGAEEPAIPSVDVHMLFRLLPRRIADAPPSLSTPHLLGEACRAKAWVSAEMPDSITRYLTAGLCGLETSMEDFDFLLSSAVTTWAFSSESDELPQVTVRPDSRTSVMLSRLLGRHPIDHSAQLLRRRSGNGGHLARAAEHHRD